MQRRNFMKRLMAGMASFAPWLAGQKFSWAGTEGGAAWGAAEPRVAVPNYAALLAQHDVVYLTPTADPAEAMPIGNGDLVGMIWMPPQGLELAINKANLWDDRLPDPPLAANWSWDVNEEERMTTLVGGARLAVRSKLPLLDPLYLDDFEARLNLYEALARMESASPLGKVKAAAWVSAQPGVLVVDYDETAREPVSREIELSRWGSRRLFHWYSQYDPKATNTGLEGTQAGADKDHVWIEQKLRAISFAVVARFVGAPYRTEVSSRHIAALVTERSERLRGQVYLAIVTSEEDPSPLAAARRKVDEAVAKGYDALLAGHRQRWAEFWAKSYIRIPEEYFENLYYFTLYQLAASSQGDYPPPHCGGFWFWNHDVRRWGHYYHWNTQQQYWPVHASNHAELARPYLEYRFRTLPEAEKQAREVHQQGGAFYADTTDRWGRGAVHEQISNNLTPGTQIAMDFWRHYLYTQDQEFLRTRAYPVMKACAQFYLDTLERDAQGTYHLPRSTPYESHLFQRDTITDLASIRQSFPVCIQASEMLGVDAELRERWRDVVKNLVEFSILDNAVDEAGKELPKVFSSGLPLVDSSAGPDANFNWKKKRMIKKGERQFNISFYCEVAPIFPSGLVGLGQRGSELFEVARGTIRSLSPGPSYCSTPIIAAARLGMSEEALAGVVQLIERFQKPVQGFLAEAISAHIGNKDYSSLRWDFNQPRKIIGGKHTEERAMLPSRWFDVPDLEVGGVLMTALNEMLLQSHDGVIRVFPALPEGWKDAAFRLRAVGAFMVTGERRAGEVQSFVVESLRGGSCRVENPWPQDPLSVRELPSRRMVPVEKNDGIVTFPTQAGMSYLVFRAGHPDTQPQPPIVRHGPNRAPKEWHGRRLGIPRYF